MSRQTLTTVHNFMNDLNPPKAVLAEDCVFQVQNSSIIYQ